MGTPNLMDRDMVAGQAGSTRLRSYRRVFVPLVYCVLFLFLVPLHGVFNEWTGVMEFFSGKELVTGSGYHGWASHFYPPLFSVFLGLLGLVVGGFVAGKVISLVSASLLLWIAYELAIELGMPEDIALWAQVFLALCPLYMQESLQADNHMLDAFIFNCGLLLFFRASKNPQTRPMFLAGVVCGFAGLTRYTSYVLVLLPLCLLAFHALRKAAVFVAWFWIGFCVVSAPWWFYNAWYNGSPLHNWNYLNAWVGAYGRDTNSLQLLWHWAGDPSVHGLASLVRSHPSLYLHNVFTNIRYCIALLLGSAGALALLVLPGALEALCSLKPKYLLAGSGVLVASVLSVSQAYVNSYYLLPWIALIVIITVAFLVRYLRRLQDALPILAQFKIGGLVIALFLAYGAVVWSRAAKEYRAEPGTYRALVDLDQITAALNAHDPHIRSKVVMAVEPARAYYVGAKYLETPFEYHGSVGGLVSYQGVSPSLVDYAAKYPSDMNGSDLRADYLIYVKAQTHLELHDSPDFAFLMDPDSPDIPKNFKLVYRSANAVVYEIVWSGSLPDRK